MGVWLIGIFYGKIIQERGYNKKSGGLQGAA